MAYDALFIEFTAGGRPVYIAAGDIVAVRAPNPLYESGARIEFACGACFVDESVDVVIARLTEYGANFLPKG